jgi:hypothetical protein
MRLLLEPDVIVFRLPSAQRDLFVELDCGIGPGEEVFWLSITKFVDDLCSFDFAARA